MEVRVYKVLVLLLGNRVLKVETIVKEKIQKITLLAVMVIHRVVLVAAAHGAMADQAAEVVVQHH